MSDTSDDVLRDLLLARGVGRGIVDHLVEIADLCANWPGEFYAIDPFDDLKLELEEQLRMESRRYAPKRPPRPLPSMEVMNGALREVWANSSVSGRQVEIFTHPLMEGRPPLLFQQDQFDARGFMLRMEEAQRRYDGWRALTPEVTPDQLRIRTEDISPGWLNRLDQHRQRDDEIRQRGAREWHGLDPRDAQAILDDLNDP